MCGYVGFTNTIDNTNVVLKKMMERIRHRGPDGEGQYIDDGIALGHRRLSIIDLAGGRARLHFTAKPPCFEEWLSRTGLAEKESVTER